MTYIIIGLAVFAVLALLVLKLKQSAEAPAEASAESPPIAFGNERAPFTPPIRAFTSSSILSDNEREFFHRLLSALPDYHIFPQVAANALLKVAPIVPKHHTHSVRNKYAQWHVDFVVCERTTLAVRAIIELDDKTHRARKDAARDAIFAAAGYTVHRFESRRKPSDEQIASLFATSPQGKNLPLDSHGF